jgi:tetratricopeptide (TPR) repeat protein
MSKPKLSAMIALLLAAPLGVLSAHAQTATGSELFQVMQREKQAVEEQLQQVRQELRQEKTNSAALQQRIAELTGTIQAAEQASRQLQTQLEAAADTETGLKETVRQEQDRTVQLMQVIAELKNLVATQADALEAQREQMAVLDSEQTALKAQLAAEKVKSQDVQLKIAAARADLEKALEKNIADRLRAHYNMAVMYDRQRMFKSAEEQYLICLELNPNDAYVHYNLGILYDAKLQEPKKALYHYRRFFALQPEGEDAEKVKEWIAALSGSQE